MTTPEARYDQLTDRAEALYSEGRQREALALFEPVDAELVPWRAELAHLQACLLGSVGETEAALRVLEEASVLGAWWQETILTEDDDLAALQALPGFRRVVALSRDRRVVDPTPPLLQLPAGEALTGRPEPAAGVVVLAPALRELPAAASTALSPATILIGSEDELLEVVEAAGAQLSAFGLTVERLPGLGHEFPADFAVRLAAVLPG